MVTLPYSFKCVTLIFHKSKEGNIYLALYEGSAAYLNTIKGDRDSKKIGKPCCTLNFHIEVSGGNFFGEFEIVNILKSKTLVTSQ